MSSENEPRCIQVHPQDNVAIIVNPGGLPAGTQFPSGLVLQEAVPEAHKVALVALQAGDAVIRYGSIIGYAARAIPQGGWVAEDALTSPPPPVLD
ncbi:MAG: galactarate dehydratase, partial [Acidobacteria bacterium]|nr:galactarate dehydratase [Acidobacteriota bacterium]